MAEVDVTGLSVKLKEAKKHIDDLRGSMLELINDGKDTAKVEEQITNEQEKLNRVMSIGKKTTNEVKGYYNQLNKELREARKAYKELSEEELKNGNEGKRLLKIIQDNDAALKELDAGMGVYTRNVGQYGIVIEEAFKRGLGSLGGVNGILGDILGTMGKLIPMIKKTTSTAEGGIKGIGAAIKAIPFMLIITALTTIISNWSDIRDSIFGVDEEYQKVINDADLFLQAQNEILDDMNRESKLMKAKGRSQKEVLEYQKKIVEGQLAEAQAQKKNLELEVQRLQSHSWLYRLIMGENGKIDEANDKIKDLDSNIASLTKQVKDINTDIQIEDITGGGKTSKQVESHIQQTLKRLRDFGKDEIQILDETFQREKKLLDDEYRHNLKKRKEYEEALTLLIKEHNEKREKALKTIAANPSDIKDRLNKGIDEDKFNEEMLQRQYNDEYTLLYNAKQAELKLAGDNAEKRKEIERTYATWFEMLNNELAENYKKLEDGKVEKTVSAEEKVLAARKEAAEKAENYNYNMSDDKGQDAQIKHIENLWAIQDDYYNSVIEMNAKLLENEYLTDEEKDKIRERIHKAELARMDAQMKKDVDTKNAMVKQEKLSWKQITQVATQGAQALGNIMSSIATMWQNDIKQKEEAGEISEEQARSEFERSKKLAYGAAILQTAAGIVNAISTSMALPQPGGAIAAAINAATVAAAGAIQIATIAKQTYDSVGSGGGGGNNPIIIPPMATYQETSVVNPTERDSIDSLTEVMKNQTVTVKITDVEKVENRKRSTVAESTW